MEREGGRERGGSRHQRLERQAENRAVPQAPEEKGSLHLPGSWLATVTCPEKRPKSRRYTGPGNRGSALGTCPQSQELARCLF